MLSRKTLPVRESRGDWISALETRLHFAAADYYAIKVIDSATGRGVPQVDLVMTDGRRYTTDSGGTVAFNRNGYMNTPDVFVVETYGYRLASGTSVTLTPVLGQSGTISLNRSQIAERMYRETGVNRWSQTVAVGGTSPINYPGVGAPGNVFGQDSGLTAVYKGKLYEFWGDTGRDLNNDAKDDGGVAGKYRTTGGIMDLPANGGLDPNAGENINYILNSDGTLKEMFPSANGFAGPLVWASSPMVTLDANGNEKLVMGYANVSGLSSSGGGFAVFNDATQQFQPVSTFSANALVKPGQNAYLTSFNGVSYYVIPAGNSFIRVRNTYADITNINSYEVYTPLKPGSNLPSDTFLGISHIVSASDINYDANGKVVWTWSPNTTILNGFDYDNLNRNGLVPFAQNPFQFKDIDTGNVISFSTSAITYNDYLKAWTFIGQQWFGSSAFGEVWFAQAKTLTGPWTWVRKVQTSTRPNVNDPYTFYNVIQHPYYSRDGRYLYYEGTNTNFLVDGGLQGEYFAANNLTGYAYKQLDGGDFSYSFGAGSPNSSLISNTDHFSARWTGTISLASTGVYQFRITTDAGAKLVINGAAIINQLSGTADTTYTAGFNNTSANATRSFELDYASLTSTNARVKLEWLTPGSTTWATVPSSAFRHDTSQPIDNYNTFMYRVDLADTRVAPLDVGTGLVTQVFDNADLTSFKGTLTGQVLNSTYADGASPLSGVAPTTYSTRTLGMIRPTFSQTYTFYATSDEGARVWINGQLLINNWAAHTTTTNAGTIALEAGRKYDIRVEYFNGTGAGQFKLEWQSASQGRQIVPVAALFPPSAGFRTTYFDDTALGTPKVSTLSPLINFRTPLSSVSNTNPGTVDPASLVNDGTWSARWTGQVRPDFTGNYTFAATSDDGIRVWVNGVKLVDQWSNHGDITSSGSINLQAGQYYDIVVEYYNDQLSATARVYWNNANQTLGVNQLIPAENVFAGATVLGGTNAIDLVSPTLTAAASRKTGAAASDLPLALGSGPGTIESRAGGADTLVLTFGEPVVPADGALDANEFTITNAQFVSAVVSGVTMTVRLSNVANAATTTLSLLGLTDATGNALAPTSITVRSLAGDIDRDGSVTFNDFLTLQNRFGQTGIGLDADLDASGTVDFTDFLTLQNSFGQSVPAASAVAPKRQTQPLTPARSVRTPAKLSSPPRQMR